VTYYVLFFNHLESRRIDIVGLTVHPNEQWMQQMARNATMDGCGALRACRYLLHDRDAKYSASFCSIIETARVKTLALPANDGSDRLRRNVCRRSFSSGDARCVGRWTSMLHTTIVNGTIRGSRTSCCSRRSRKHAGRDLCDVANGSAGSCAITIRTPLELAGRIGGRS
jgi:hypothetical protein